MCNTYKTEPGKIVELDKNFNLEKSNNPKDQMGIKKVPVHLVPPVGIIQEAMAMKWGAYQSPRKDGKNGYGPYNWRETEISYTVMLAAILRHLLALLDREDLATDSGIHHAAHIKAGCGIILDCLANGNLIDDRPPKGKASQLLDVFKETDEQKS